MHGRSSGVAGGRKAGASGGIGVLSVVIPTRDTRDLTTACLRSLLATASVPCEIVVVDDAGNDGTPDLVERDFPGVRVVRLATSRGFTAAANAGLAATSGDPVLLLNSDTTVLPGALLAVVGAFDSDPGLGIVGARLLDPEGTPQWSGGREPTLPWIFVMASGLAAALGRSAPWRRRVPPSGHRAGAVEWVAGAAMAMRRRVWQEAGPLDESFRLYMQDLAFCGSARDRGWRVAIEPAFRVVHVGGATVARTHEAGMDRQDAALLWADLLDWGYRRRGPAWAARCRRVLRLGALVAVARLAVSGCVTAGDARRRSVVGKNLLRHALAELERADPGAGA